MEKSPFRVFYRVVGSNIAESLGLDVSGRYLDETGLEQTNNLEEIYRFLLAHNAPSFFKGHQTVLNYEFDYEGCALPFGREDDDPRLLVIAEDIFPEAAWREALIKRSYEINFHR
ncbi:hypothetical protein ACTL6U_14540 [Rhodovibrionaceae bacterium A322]